MSLPRDIYEEFKAQAERLSDTELSRHAAVGDMCRCDECFLCVAHGVLRMRTLRAELKEYYNAKDHSLSNADERG